MSAKQFYNDSMYIGTDYNLVLSDEWNGVEQDLTNATFSGGLRLGLTPITTQFSFTLLDNFNVRCTIEAAQTQGLTAGIYDFGVRIKYNGKATNEDDDLLFHGKIEVKTSLF